jgi:hypothetical protein
MAVRFSNNAATELASGVGPSDTSITVVDGSLFPALGAGDYTYVTLDADTDPPLREIVRVTAIAGNTLTVVRAQDGSTASAFGAGAKVELRLTAALLNDVATEASVTNWADVQNKPDPTLTLTGDVTGTVTFTDLGNATLTTSINGYNNSNWDAAYSWGDHSTAGYLVSNSDGSDLQDVRAETVEVTIKNVSGAPIAKGTPVHQTGTSGASTFEVVAADASNAALMPAHFVAAETLANQAEGRGILMGRISGVDTSSFSEGDTIYVAIGGGYTNSPPTGEGGLIQNLGTITRVDANNGGGEVMGAGRSAATPNLNDGNIFIGNASNQASTASLSLSVSNLPHYNNVNWDTAYSWGDHASQGYATTSDAIAMAIALG